MDIFLLFQLALDRRGEEGRDGNGNGSIPQTGGFLCAEPEKEGGKGQCHQVRKIKFKKLQVRQDTLFCFYLLTNFSETWLKKIFLKS